MTESDIYQFTDPIEYINSVFVQRKLKHPHYSFRLWAKRLGIEHHTLLHMVVSGKRRLKDPLLSKLSKDTCNDEKEMQYFDLLVRCKYADEGSKEIIAKQLHDLNPEQPVFQLEQDQAHMLSDWHHFAIREMTQTKNFDPSPKAIAKKLGAGMTTLQVEEAVARLLRLGVLERTPKGSLAKSSNNTFAIRPRQRSESIRKIHKQILHKAINAVDGQPNEHRDISAHLICTSARKVKQASKMIEEFRMKLGSFLEEEQGETVFAVSVQLFDLLGERHV